MDVLPSQVPVTDEVVYVPLLALLRHPGRETVYLGFHLNIKDGSIFSVFDSYNNQRQN